MQVFFRQFRALTYKNFLLRRRHPFRLIFEIGIPTAIFLFFIWIRATTSTEVSLIRSILPDETLHNVKGSQLPRMLKQGGVPICSWRSNERDREFVNNFQKYYQFEDIVHDTTNATFFANDYVSFVASYVDSRGSIDTVGRKNFCFPACVRESIEPPGRWWGNSVFRQIDQSMLIDGCDLESIEEFNRLDLSSSLVMKEVVVAPQSQGNAGQEAIAQRFLDYLQTTYNETLVKFVMYSSESAIGDHIGQLEYGRDIEVPQIAFAVVFNGEFPNYDVTIRSNYTRSEAPEDSDESQGQDGNNDNQLPPMNLNFVPLAKQIEDEIIYDICPGNYGSSGCAGLYVESGFMGIQTFVSDWIVTDSLIQGGYAGPTLEDRFDNQYFRFSFMNFPSAGYEEAGFWGSIKDVFAIFVIIGFMLSVGGMVSALVDEKERKLKEGMKMMSLGNGALVCSWVIHFGMVFWTMTIIISVAASELFLFSDSFLIFVYFFAFLNSTMSFCYWISSLFSRAKTASIISLMMYFAGYFVVVAVQSSTSRDIKLLASLHPTAAFSFGLTAFVEYEDSGQGVTLDTWNVTSNPDGYTFLDCCTMLIFDIFFWGLMTWYFDAIMPSEWGSNKPPWFLFQPAYWVPSLRRAIDEEIFVHDDVQAKSETDDNVEGVSEELMTSIKAGEGIHINGLRKSFKTPAGVKHAVDGLSLDMFNNQITCLLGHNGAGKTTTIAMLTGLIPMTSGFASVNGLDVATNMDEIRKDLGVCPQHDILYPDLTVYEHLSLFATFKGVANKDLKTEINKMIVGVGLVEKTNTKSSSLSGGMKRKLSIAIAFCGGSSTVLLDECTSGMDPFSRRFAWNVIRQMRENRTIILTTHFMDEADILGDRIAIMAEGKLRCAGSSLFLKNKFGVGYTMAIEKGKRFDESKVVGMITDLIPDAAILSNVGTSLSFQLPLSASAAFGELFETFDDGLHELDIITYGVSVTTLEEVFLKVAHGGDHDKSAATKTKEQMSSRRVMHKQKSDLAKSLSIGKMELGHLDSIQEDEVDGVGNEKLNVNNHLGYFMRHMIALLYKRLLYFKRDKKAWVFGFILPFLFVVFGLWIMTVTRATLSQPSLELSMTRSNPGRSTNPVVYPREGAQFRCPIDRRQQQGSEIEFCPISNTNYISRIAEIDEEEIVALPVPQDFFDLSQWLLDNKDRQAETTYGAILFIGGEQVEDDDESCDKSQPTPCPTISQEVPPVDEVSPYPVSALVSTNWTSIHALPTFVSGMYESAMKNALGDDKVTLVTRIHPLPATQSQNADTSVLDSFFAVLMILMGFPFIPSAFIVFVVREKENKAKHIQLVSGVSPHSYWLSTWIWDFLSYQIPLWATIIALTSYDVKALIEGEAYEATLYLFLGYGAAMTGFVYCISFYFNSHTSAQLFVIFFSFLTGFMLAFASIIMSFFPATQDVNRTLMIFWRIIPGFSFGHGLIAQSFALIITLVDYQARFDEWNKLSAITKLTIPEPSPVTEALGPLDDLIAGADIRYMFWSAFGYLFLAIGIEYFLATPSLFSWLTNRIHKAPPLEKFVEDSDVVEESRRVQENAADLRAADRKNENPDAIVVEDLIKVYPGGKFAVKGVSLGIPYGECFGLLGINGAGKTTTLSILSGEFPPSGGSAWIAGKDILTQANQVRRLIGYCPQFDALFELMTGEEHLMMYARIKGIREQDIRKCVDDQIVKMDLTSYAKRLAGTYSGGNKRKLSVACAMIGQPSIIFLDEPSTGVDPVAKRFMWNVINDICKAGKTSVILTTHSMEECEALCQRIGIMVGGRFRCLGSAQHLKAKFGLGYQLEFGIKVPQKDEIVEEHKSLINSNSGKDLDNVTIEQFKAILVKMGRGDWLESLALGSGSELHENSSLFEAASWSLTEARCRKLKAFMATTYNGSVMRERQGLKMRYEVPSGDGLKLSGMFRTLEANKEDLEVQEYSLSQTSLEQVFNSFASTQQEEVGKAAGLT